MSIWIHSHRIACCFILLPLLVLGTIFKCASWVRLSVAALAALQWTDWYLHCCCVSAGGALHKVPIIWLDSDRLAPCRDVSGSMISYCWQGEEDDNENKWEFLRNIYSASSQNGMINSQLQQNVFLSLGASRSVWEDVECKVRSVNFRRVSDLRRAFWPAFSITGISDDRYGSTMGAVVKGLGAPGTVAQPMGESQINSERCRVLMNIHSKECRRYLRFSGCTQAIRIPSTYDA